MCMMRLAYLAVASRLCALRVCVRSSAHATSTLASSAGLSPAAPAASAAAAAAAAAFLAFSFSRFFLRWRGYRTIRGGGEVHGCLR